MLITGYEWFYEVMVCTYFQTVNMFVNHVTVIVSTITFVGNTMSIGSIAMRWQL